MNFFPYKILLILITFSFTVNVNAYWLSTGTYVPYFNSAQISNEGQTQKFAINPYLGIGTQMPMSASQFFSPEFGFAYFLNTAKNTKKDTIFLHYNFSYILSGQFTFRYGLTNNWYRLHGKGGSVSLSNGNGTTKFPSPDKTVVSYYTTLNLGTEYILTNRQYSVRFDFQIMSFKELDNKAYNYILTFNLYR